MVIWRLRITEITAFTCIDGSPASDMNSTRGEFMLACSYSARRCEGDSYMGAELNSSEGLEWQRGASNHREWVARKGDAEEVRAQTPASDSHLGRTGQWCGCQLRPRRRGSRFCEERENDSLFLRLWARTIANCWNKSNPSREAHGMVVPWYPC